MGKPYEIPQISLNSKTGAYSVSVGKEATDADMLLFKKQQGNFDTLKIRMIKFAGLDATTFLLGIKPRLESNIDCYIASQDGQSHPFTSAALLGVANSIENRSSFSSSATYKIRTHQQAVINDDYYRCCAKIAFNCLADLNGKDFVLQECFHPLREWIVNGGENNFVDLAPKFASEMQGIFPEDSHHILISKVDNQLIADVCFYNHFHNTVTLTHNFSGPFSLNGFICDWKKHQEYDLDNYLAKLPTN